MGESEMGTIVVVAAAAAVAIGGAAIALTYRCCSDLSKKQRGSRSRKVENQANGVDSSAAAEVEDQERVELFKSSRTGYSEEAVKRPAARTVEEIKAKYGRATRKGASDAAGVAAEARDKLMERGEKLAAVNQKTEELQSEAENFASLAEELAKKMKSRKWWEL